MDRPARAHAMPGSLTTLRRLLVVQVIVAATMSLAFVTYAQTEIVDPAAVDPTVALLINTLGPWGVATLVLLKAIRVADKAVDEAGRWRRALMEDGLPIVQVQHGVSENDRLRLIVTADDAG